MNGRCWTELSIIILEDDPERVEAMQESLQRRLPAMTVEVFNSAPTLVDRLSATKSVQA